MIYRLDESVPAHLSPTRLRVLELLLDGRSDAEIAWALGLSCKAVKRHIAGIRALSCGEQRPAYDRRWLVALAYRIGLNRR